MLKIKNVIYTVPPNKKILNDVNLTIKNKEQISIVGQNGAGKSTLLKLITNLIEPTYGEVERNYNTNDVSFVLQDVQSSTFKNLTLKQNMLLAYYKRSTSLLSYPQVDCEYWLKKLNLGLEEKVNQPLSSLSGGQRQALSIIMAIMTYPKLLILDEHTSALDPITAKNLMDLTFKLCKEYQITTVMVTHNLDHAVKYSDRVLVLKNGSIKHDLTNVQNVQDLMSLLLPETKDTLI